MDFKDYYNILGVDKKASADEIKQAYRRLARKYHPDVSKADDAEARFKEVGEAYEVLKDKDRRAEYDQLRQYANAPGGFRPPPGWSGTHGRGAHVDMGASGFSDFFEAFFGGQAAGGSPFGGSGFGGRPQARRGADIQGELTVTLEEAATGCERTVQIDHGRRVKVKVPVGIEDGGKIRLRGQGEQSAGGNGDLILTIHLARHRLFRREGSNLHIKVNLAPWEAALGAVVPVPTLQGAVELKVPAGSQSGQKMRLKGKGLPGKAGGDLLVELLIRMPQTTEAVREALQQLQAAAGDFDPRQ